MNTRNLLIALAGVAVIAGATACGTSSSPPQATSDSPSATTSLAPAAPAAPAPQRACRDIGGTVNANRVCRAHTAGPGYKVTFTFPVDYPDQQALSDYMTKRRDDFISFAAERPPHDHPYELDATAKVNQSKTTDSLVFEVYSESGGAHPVTGYHAFNYDLVKGVPITFETLFKPNAVAVLDPIVQREMDRIWRSSGGPAQENTLGDKVYQEFAVTDDAVIFFIGQGMWLPEVAGPHQVSVSRAELTSILA